MTYRSSDLSALRSSDLGQFVPVVAALCVIWAWFGITEAAFLSPRNIYFLFMQSAVVGTLAVGVTLVLLLGEIDLSIAAVCRCWRRRFSVSSSLIWVCRHLSL